jgi:hypothetical protein
MMSLLMSPTTMMPRHQSSLIRHIQRTLATWHREQHQHHLDLVLLPQGLAQEISPSIQMLLRGLEHLLTCQSTQMLHQDPEDLLLTCQPTQMPPRHIGHPQTCQLTQTLPQGPEVLPPTCRPIQMLLLYLEDLRQLVLDLVQCQTLKLPFLRPTSRDEHHHQHMHQELARGGWQTLKSGHHLIRTQLPRSRVSAHQECVRRLMVR